MIGATITPTGTPAARSCATASRRACGGDVRGSRMRCSFGSSDVIEMLIATALCAASSDKTSMSRVTSRFFVIMPTGLRNLASTSRQRRVICNFRSTADTDPSPPAPTRFSRDGICSGLPLSAE
jgi:hypothetical protein